MIHARIQEFSSGRRGGGGGGGSRSIWHIKKGSENFFLFFIFFCPQLILQKSSCYFQRKLLFAKIPVGLEHFPGGATFYRGGPIAFSL